MSDVLREVSLQTARAAAHDTGQLLAALGGPAWLRIPGQGSGAPRMMTTLLHGNEPSGLLALGRLVHQRVVPAHDLICVVVSVEAATTAPRFSRRSVPGRPDQNRCFVAPHEGLEGRIAESLLQLVADVAPTSLVDLHNTSGASPAYGVCCRSDSVRMGLVSLWAELCIHTDLRLGTIMEATDPLLPTVTVECGGARQASSHDRAFDGLRRYAIWPELPTDVQLPVLPHPIRVELAEGASLSYGARPDPDADITLPLNVDAHNFGTFSEGQRIGWLGPRGLDALRLAQASSGFTVGDLFRGDAGELTAACELTPLMVTTDPEVARTDCLFYLATQPKE